MNIEAAKTNLMQMINNIDVSKRHTFVIQMKNYIEEVLEELSQNNADVMIGAIQDDIRETMPMEAVFPSEEIVPPSIGENSDCDKRITVHVDGFLYDEDTIDDLCDEGKMSRHYCTQCGCQQVAPLKFISHSSSLTQLKYMFQYMLPDLNGKTLLDIGSRTGAVLYGAYYYSGTSNIIGVEINHDFCNLQQGIVKKYDLGDRIKILHSDICAQMDILQRADVIFMNNVFEFFAPVEIQQRIWQHLSQWIRKSGVLVVTSPSLDCALKNLNTGINIQTWVEKVDTSNVMKQANFIMWNNENSEESDLHDVHLYRVL